MEGGTMPHVIIPLACLPTLCLAQLHGTANPRSSPPVCMTGGPLAVL